jgi:hypothetical protein
MRLALALAIVFVAACNIPGVTFTPLGGGDDAGGDDGNGSSDGGQMADAAPGSTAYGYIIDTNGIYTATRDLATGNVALANPSPTTVAGSTFYAAVTNRPKTFLFVVESTGVTAQVRQFPLANGEPSFPVTTFPIGASCSVGALSLHPSGNFLAVGCANQVAIFQVRPGGDLAGAPMTYPLPGGGGMGIRNVQFSPNGLCLFATTPGGGGGGEFVRAMGFDPGTGDVLVVLGGMQPTGARALAVDANSTYLYAVGNGSLATYSLDATCHPEFITNMPAGTNLQQVVINPDASRLFAFGTEVHSFTLAGGVPSPVSGNPFLPGTILMEGAIIDPVLPTILYITSRGFGGTFPASIDANGKVATTGLTGAMTGSANVVWFTLGAMTP